MLNVMAKSSRERLNVLLSNSLSLWGRAEVRG
jgi:hypothetical protein